MDRLSVPGRLMPSFTSRPDAVQQVWPASRSSASTAARREVPCGGVSRRAPWTSRAQCSSSRPWFGRDAGDRACQSSLITVQRGGSNVYFPLVASSIYIPPEGRGRERGDIEGLECPGGLAGVYRQSRRRPHRPEPSDFLASMQGVDAAALYEAAEARLHRTVRPAVSGISDEDYRRQELRCSDGPDGPADRSFIAIPLRVPAWMACKYIKQVGLVRKLRETRALVGFSRNMPRGERERWATAAFPRRGYRLAACDRGPGRRHLHRV